MDRKDKSDPGRGYNKGNVETSGVVTKISKTRKRGMK